LDYPPQIDFLTLAAVFEFEGMKSSTTLSTFDRIGVAVVALLGTCLGWGISTANDIVLTPTLAVLFPGSVVGFAVLKFVGRNIAGIVSGVANGGIYGLVLYGWNRIAVVRDKASSGQSSFGVSDSFLKDRTDPEVDF
jgi:hypothetical protein